MLDNRQPPGMRVVDVIDRYGRCLELIPRDPHFADITVGLYERDEILTVWTFSHKPRVEERIRRIRDRMVELGGLTPIQTSPNQARLSCGGRHSKLLGFLLRQAVEKDPDSQPTERPLSIADSKTPLTLHVEARRRRGRWLYQISASGDPEIIPRRLPAVLAGFLRYGEMEKVETNLVSFRCGARHDDLIRLLLPYSRNVSAVETMLEESALRGQLTTGTAGFSPM